MKTTVCIFEDEEVYNFFPLTFTRPVYDLRCGVLSLGEKIFKRFSGHNFILHSRRFLLEQISKKGYPALIGHSDAERILFINGRLLISAESFSRINELAADSILLSGDGAVVAANLSKEHLNDLYAGNSDYLAFRDLKKTLFVESPVNLIKYTWDLVNFNGNEIANDFDLLEDNSSIDETGKYKSVEFRNRKKIIIGRDSVIDPFVFLDASEGPIVIGNNVRIMSHSFIQGPASIGNDSIIKKGATVYHNTSIGEYCKVGGEVESSVILSFTNKQHEGFLGHSYLGSWINIGAGTNNSDLKNNYENITVLLNGKPVDTGSRFVGLIMGDHSKTAINTMFNTGTIAGVSCNIFGEGFPPRYIPSFSWGGSAFLKQYDIKKSLDVAEIVMKRRNRELTPEEENMLRKVFELTGKERLIKLKS